MLKLQGELQDFTQLLKALRLRWINNVIEYIEVFGLDKEHHKYLLYCTTLMLL